MFFRRPRFTNHIVARAGRVHHASPWIFTGDTHSSLIALVIAEGRALLSMFRTPKRNFPSVPFISKVGRQPGKHQTFMFGHINWQRGIRGLQGFSTTSGSIGRCRCDYTVRPRSLQMPVLLTGDRTISKKLITAVTDHVVFASEPCSYPIRWGEEGLLEGLQKTR